MSIETAAGLQVVQAETADAAEMARVITEAAIWRKVEKGLNRWPTELEQNLALAARAIGQGTGYVGYAEGQAVAAMLLSGPDESDKALWGEAAGDPALYVHKLSVGVDCHDRKYGNGMLDAANSIAAKAGKTALRLHYIYAPQYEGLRQYYKNQGFTTRGKKRNCDGGCTTVALLERPVGAAPAEAR